MLNRAAHEAIDRCLQDLTGSSAPFGGKVVVFGGDFRQILPIIEKASKEEVLASLLTALPLWRAAGVHVHRLDRNVRASEDPGYQDFLEKVGNGILPSEAKIGPDSVRLPDEICAPSTRTEETLTKKIFPDLGAAVHLATQAGSTAEAMEYFADRAILAPRHEDADQANNKILDNLPGDNAVYHSIDKILGGTQEARVIVQGACLVG